MKRIFLFFALCLCSFLTAFAQYDWTYYFHRGEPWYDFYQDGVFYKFGTVPDDGYYIDTSYTDENGNEIKDGFYTGLPSEGEILWVVGQWSTYNIGSGGKMKVSDSYDYRINDMPNIYIPDSVEYKGKKYAVKGIAENAFAGYNERTIRLPECLEYIMPPGFESSGVIFRCYDNEIVHIPSSLKYYHADIGNHNDIHPNYCTFVFPKNLLYFKEYSWGTIGIGRPYQSEKEMNIVYPSQMVCGGQIKFVENQGKIEWNSKDKFILPEKMKHLFGDYYPLDVLVIPDNGEIQIYDSGIGGSANKHIKTIFSYAPIIRDRHKGFGLQSFVDSEPVYAEKTLYVLPGRKAAYAEEWPDLMAGAEYSPVGLTEKRLYSEDHIIEISREKMDAMVEAAGLTVPTSVSEVEVSPSKKVKETIYTPDGRRWQALQKGVNIVRQSDGTTRKVYVK